MTPDADAPTSPGIGLTGHMLGPYVVGPLLGLGGMGVVYEARDPRLNRDVAIKIIQPQFASDPERVRRMEREARAVAALSHPNVLAIFDIGSHEGVPYIVTERLRGETLKDRLVRERPPVAWTIGVAIQVADALAAAHERGVLHRDLKPANVMLTADDRVKLLDFGVAKLVANESGSADTTGSNQSDRGKIIGTPAYMAPEQLLGGKADARSDVYGLGVMLFEMLTGRRPFEGDNYVSFAINPAIHPPAPIAIEPAVPPALSDLVTRCLARDRDDRPASAGEVRQELERCRAALSSGDAAALAAPRATRNGRPRGALRRLLWPAAALAGLVTIVALVPWWRTLAPAVARGSVVAVLPLANLTGQAANDYLGVGIADALTSSLASVPGLALVSADAARASNKANTGIQAIARELGATVLITGGVQRTNDRLRVDTRAVQPDGTVIWSGHADGLLSDLLALERLVAGRLVSGLKLQASADPGALPTPATVSQEALERYWQGTALLERTDEASIDQAITTLERAVAADGQFALAHAGLGAAFVRKYNVTNDQVWMQKAEQSVTRALELDPNQTAVRLSLASVYRQTGRNGTAVEQLRRVLAQDPANDEARRRLGTIFESEGRPEEARDQYQSAVNARPTYWLNHDALGMFYLSQSRYQEAISAFTRVTELRPDSAYAFQRLGTAYQSAGNRAEARRYLEQALRIQPDPAAFSNLGTLHYSEGRFDEAAKAYQEAIRLRPNRALYHRNLGDAYVKLNRGAEARAEYEAAAKLTTDALAVNPNDARIMAQLAVYLAKIGRHADARQYIVRAMAINPTSGEILHRRASVAALAGDTATALDAVRQAIAAGRSATLVNEDDDLASLRAFPAFQTNFGPPPPPPPQR